jgi:hypothetical protein
MEEKKANLSVVMSVLAIVIALLIAGAGFVGAYNGQDGINGVKGDKGDKGDDGIHGDDGSTGPEGIQGPAGPTGTRGTTGPAGKNGKDAPINNPPEYVIGGYKIEDTGEHFLSVNVTDPDGDIVVVTIQYRTSISNPWKPLDEFIGENGLYNATVTYCHQVFWQIKIWDGQDVSGLEYVTG